MLVEEKKGSQSWKEDGWISPLTATTQIPAFQIVPAMILLSSWRIWLFRGAHSVGAASLYDRPARTVGQIRQKCKETSN